MREDPVAKALCILLYNSMKDSNLVNFSAIEPEAIMEGIEGISEEILHFFADADSYKPEWSLKKTSVDEGLFSDSEFASSFHKMAYDEYENEAIEKAELGDYRLLESLIEDRGFLRTCQARRLIVDRLQGKRKKGRPKTTVNIDTFDDILNIRARHGCSEYRAKKIWLEDNLDISEETLKHRLSEAKKDPVRALLLQHLKLRKNTGVEK